MLVEGCIVMDRWTANPCFDQKEELLLIKALRHRVRWRDKEKSGFNERLRVRVATSLEGPKILASHPNFQMQ